MGIRRGPIFWWLEWGGWAIWKGQGCLCLQHAVVVTGMHWNAVLPKEQESSRDH